MEPDRHASEPAWNDALLQNPHAVKDKQSRVREMFAAIAPSYDFNNRLHSLGQDQRWRRRAVKLANLKATDVVVDVACGTGDLTLAFFEALLLERLPVVRRLESPGPARVLGIDFTVEMLPLARSKALTCGFRGHVGDLSAHRSLREQRANHICFLNGDAQSLPLPDACADVVSIAFGIRNVADPAIALREFRRILRPGGRLIILEFSQPSNRLIRWCNDLYCTRIMPHTATWISRDKSGAYKYLPMSVKSFINRQQMMLMMRDAGFSEIEQFPMTFGVCVAYRGIVSETSKAT